MPEFGLPPQIVMTVPLLEGTDGVEKMSKSLGNTIGITDPPGEIFGKVMSISDDLMWRYYLLCTDLSQGDIDGMRSRAAAGDLHPRDAKVRLARSIVADFHDEAAARAAEEEFRRVFSGGETPEDVPEARLSGDDPALDSSGGEGPALLLAVLLSGQGLAPSRSAARRLLAQGAVSADGERIRDERLPLPEERLRQGILLKVGKRRYLKVRLA
jgi:tyrosyl-tRNA synthetase